MNVKAIILVGAAIGPISLAGCINMPTPASQITGSYTSSLRYEEFECSKLSVELDSLARRENQLVVAQEQRVKSSQMQAFWWGMVHAAHIQVKATEWKHLNWQMCAERKKQYVKRLL